MLVYFGNGNFVLRDIASKRESKQAIRGECFGQQTRITPQIAFEVQLGKLKCNSAYWDVYNILNLYFLVPVLNFVYETSPLRCNSTREFAFLTKGVNSSNKIPDLDGLWN